MGGDLKARDFFDILVKICPSLFISNKKGTFFSCCGASGDTLLRAGLKHRCVVRSST